jgi:transcription elongation GreA/GreB family factor
VFLLSENSPLGQSLIGKKENEEIQFRGKPMKILEIS